MQLKMSSCKTVAGVWTRLFEEDPIGDDASADKTTLVLWTQAPASGIYVDIRLPLKSPGRSDTTDCAARKPSPSSLRATKGALSKDYDLSILTAQKSFAGVLTFKEGDTSDPPGVALAKDTVLADLVKDSNAALPLCTCFWRRDVDMQPPSGGLDIGVCASYSPQAADGTVDLRETGDDGSYAEGWRRMGNTHQGPFLALELVSENGHARTGYWVRTGHRFAYAVGRPTSVENAQALGCVDKSCSVKDQVGKTLAEAVSDMKSNGDEDILLDVIGSYVAVAGEITADNGAWKILDSTNPGLVHCYLVGAELEKDEVNCSTLRCDSKDVKEGDTIDQVVRGDGAFVRKWKVVEMSGCLVPFL